ncbi:581_t:CDS:10 [Funneliformis mosseae]|uniref:581_t:CDS:1 n=1 Tax=Funneliformis mosseae TaxID=27381 RepID=A0A9N8ZBG3_FUNMO|nr:581_t:CDS:10 [Funneliformis mosseae]
MKQLLKVLIVLSYIASVMADVDDGLDAPPEEFSQPIPRPTLNSYGFAVCTVCLWDRSIYNYNNVKKTDQNQLRYNLGKKELVAGLVKRKVNLRSVDIFDKSTTSQGDEIMKLYDGDNLKKKLKITAEDFQSNSNDTDFFDDLYIDNENKEAPTEKSSTDIQYPPIESEEEMEEIQYLITKMENMNHRLFEYHIVNLSKKNLTNPVNKVFSIDDKEKMKKYWEEIEPSAEEKQNTTRQSKWEKTIKPLINKYALAIKVRPESIFDNDAQQSSTKVILIVHLRTNLTLKSIMNFYDILLFTSSFNILRDANTLEIAYRDSFVNPIILKIYMNASEIEIGFFGSSGKCNASGSYWILYRYGKTVQSDANFNFLSTSALLKTQCNRRTTSMSLKLWCTRISYRKTIIYAIHCVKGGLYVVDIITNFTILDNKDQVYVIDKILEKIYFFKLQEISRKVQKHSSSDKNLLKASSSKHH